MFIIYLQRLDTSSIPFYDFSIFSVWQDQLFVVLGIYLVFSLLICFEKKTIEISNGVGMMNCFVSVEPV